MLRVLSFVALSLSVSTVPSWSEGMIVPGHDYMLLEGHEDAEGSKALMGQFQVDSPLVDGQNINACCKNSHGAKAMSVQVWTSLPANAPALMPIDDQDDSNSVGLLTPEIDSMIEVLDPSAFLTQDGNIGLQAPVECVDVAYTVNHAPTVSPVFIESKHAQNTMIAGLGQNTRFG